MVSVTSGRRPKQLAPVRGTYETRPTRRGISVAMRYLSMRRAQLTKIHQRDLNVFAGDFEQQYGGEEPAMLAYFSEFKRRVDEAQAEYNRRKDEIMADLSSSLMERHKAVERLGDPLHAAWTDVSETAFLHTYGDPRRDSMLWDQALAYFEAPIVADMRNMKQVDYHRTPWEMFEIRLLENPAIDGSVAPCVRTSPLPASVLSGRAANTRATFVPPGLPNGEDIDPKLYKAMVAAAAKVCPHCYLVFPAGLKQHELKCAKEHDVDPILQGRAIDDGVSTVQGQLPATPDDEREEDDEE